ncbi:MAG: hypothetical protein KA716_29650 [Gloeotrichia echinulata DEX184]|nr:hypothetical protein [Gloeotrichia echinulata DEX184]
MSNSSFFDEQKEQSLIKARIVKKYFWAWAKVIGSSVLSVLNLLNNQLETLAELR